MSANAVSNDDPKQPLLGDGSETHLCCGVPWSIATFGTYHMDEEQGKRAESKGGSVHVTDEAINTMTHFGGFLFSVLGLTVLVTAAAMQSKVWHIVSFSIYGASLSFMFFASTLHHGIHSTPAVEYNFLLMDYAAIFPLISGSFSPFCLVCLHDHWAGWVFFGVSWGLSIMGIVMVLSLRKKLPRWVLGVMFILLGWMGGLLAFWLIHRLPLGAIVLLAVGGVLYSIGFVVFEVEKPNPVPGRFGFHEIWHILVVLAAIVHWCCMYFYILPYPA